MDRLIHELDKLGVLVAVAEKGKINEAVGVLHRTQPSISRSIQKLEEAFGTEIFLRNRDGVKLTKAGTLLYEKAVRIIRELEDIQAQAKNVEDDMAGALTVGTYESLAEYLWPDILMKFQTLYPHLQLSIKTSLNQDSIADLLSGKIDMLVDAEPQLRSSLVSWPIYFDHFGFFVSTSNRINQCKLSESADQTVIFVQKAFDKDRLTIEDHLDRAGHRFRRQYCFDSFSTAKRLAIRGMGIAILPIRLAIEDVRKKIIKPIELEGFGTSGFGRHTIYATVSEENRKDVRIKKIIAQLKKHFI